MNPTIQLASGRYFNYENFGPGDINIWDIAHALSNLCRYTGHCQTFYSVAQHSVLVSEIVPTHLALEGLLHDATEAYVGDVNRPLKMLLPQYREIEQRVDAAIRERFRLPVQESPEVKEADNILLVTESRDLMPPSPGGVVDEWGWARDIPRLARPITPLPAVLARSQFIRAFETITGEML